MKYLMLTLMLLPFFAIGQEGKDPNATKLLDQISQKFKNTKSIQADFDLVIKLPDTQEDIQSGNIRQAGDKVNVKLATQEIISDGDDMYIVLVEQKIAQRYSAAEMKEQNTMMTNPFEMLEMYKSDEYEYAIVGDENIGGKDYVAIEFKPVDRYAEYSKVRLAIDKSKMSPKYIKVFGKDGSNYTLDLKNVILDKEIPNQSFIFNKSDYPGIQVEDLRI